jgi:RNA polymerase-interacting CarD/CdnL/TRCF family regulator
MSFHVGDSVMHWTYGLGQVVGLEERVIAGQKTLYYAVKVRDLTVWVPADDNLEKRLRVPTPAAMFEKLFTILTGSGEPLPIDRLERKTRLAEQFKEGRAESLCRVIRDLFAFQQGKTLNDNDQILMKRAQNALLGEWVFSLSVPPTQAESDMYRLLNSSQATD